MPDPTPTTFFSYSRADTEFVLRLAKDLRVAGANVWLDQLDIGAGQLWDHAVEEALRASPRQVAVLSPEAVNSQNVMDEVSYALEEHKQVIPVLYRDCQIPFRLRRVQYIDFRTDYDRGLRDLLRTLGAVEQGAPEAGARKPSEGPPQPDLEKRPKGEAGQEQSAGAAELLRETIQKTLEHPPIDSGTRAPSKKLWVAAVIGSVLALAAGIWYMSTRTEPRDESKVASEIKNKISEDTKVPEKDISIRVTNDAVELSGKVSSDVARNAATEDAKIEGVNVVINNLEVEARPRPIMPKRVPQPSAPTTAEAKPVEPVATAVIPEVPVPLGRRVAIMNANSGLCLSPAGGARDLNNPVVQFTCDQDPARFWNFTVANGDIVQIRNLSNNLCLTIAGGSTELNEGAVQYTCDSDPSRRWRYTTVDETTFRLVNVHSNLCLTIAGGGNDKNMQAVQYRCDGDLSRNWRLLR